MFNEPVFLPAPICPNMQISNRHIIRCLKNNVFENPTSGRVLISGFYVHVAINTCDLGFKGLLHYIIVSRICSFF